MKTDRLQDALGMIRDDFVLDARSERKTVKKPLRRWGTLAACLCLAAVCAVAVPRLLHRETPAPHPDDTPIAEPGPEPVTPGTNPAEPQSHYDWPVIYNQVDTMPDGPHYVAIAGRPLTEAEKEAVIPACLRSMKLESARANFGGSMYEDGRLQEDARLDSVELRFTDPDRGCAVHVGLWPAGRTSLFSWASQFDPEPYQATNFGSDHERQFLTLFECEDTVWTYLTCGDVSYYVSADKEFRDGIGDNFYYVVLSLLRSDNNAPDLSIIVPNP